MEVSSKNLFVTAIVLSLFFNELFIFGGFGISVPIYLIVYYCIIFWYCRILDIKIKLRDNILFIPIILLTLCFILFDNTFLKVLNIVFLYFIVLMNTINIIYLKEKEEYGIKTFCRTIKILILYPFQYIGKSFSALKKNIADSFKEKIIVIYKLIIGIFIGLILLIIVIPLLMSSDAGFSNIINLIFENLSFRVIMSVIKRIITFILIFFPMYSFNYGLTHSVEEENKKKLTLKMDFTIIITVTSIISVIYVLFCLSKLQYFLSSFIGVLPTEYSYSEYARRGFFETIPLSLINFMFILLLTKLRYQSTDKVKIIIEKIYVFFIGGFSLFLIISSLSKMQLYMKVYGLTMLRIYASWFLLLMLLIIIIVFLNCIKKIKTFKYISVIFTIMFIGLNYFNADCVVAKYNSRLYKNNQAQVIDSFESLSISAAEIYCALDIKEKDKYTIYKDNEIRDNYISKLENSHKWQQWNIPKYRAEKALYN